MIGMTSVTFRGRTAEEIVALSREAGLQGIEWGGDVHLPPGDTDRAAEVAKRTQDAGLAVLSYGSYHRLLEGMDFAPVLRSAAALGAPMIRVWAGTMGSAQADAGAYHRAAKELRELAAQAADQGMEIGLEYHRGTLTDTAPSAKRLLEMAGAANASTYWQPNPDLTLEQQLEEIRLLRGYISNLHVFQWTKGNVKHALAEGQDCWNAYLTLLRSGRHHYILEFVQDDDADAFRRDARTLADWVTPL